MALSICGFAGDTRGLCFCAPGLRPGVASRGCASLTPGCALAPLQGACGGDDWMMWGWVWRVGCVFLRSGRLWW